MLAEFDHVQSIQVHIDKWAGHLEFTRLDEALCFLSDNCGLAIQWLEDIVESLKSSAAPLDGGLLVVAALDKLEGEFRRLLDDHSSPLPMASSRDNTIAPGYPKANRMQIGVLNAV
ncbi:hypothetical protein KSP40_PGU019199 [Platanthera guangdongensis]|uniref:Uncharacterized protein n=1 Tax=Platanthera guangdongensis TaxID=2320717 RepID=A0ABR2M7D9_9ASPA